MPTRSRSAKNGKFVSKKFAGKHKATTVNERVTRPQQATALRAARRNRK